MAYRNCLPAYSATRIRRSVWLSVIDLSMAITVRDEPWVAAARGLARLSSLACTFPCESDFSRGILAARRADREHCGGQAGLPAEHVGGLFSKALTEGHRPGVCIVEPRSGAIDRGSSAGPHRECQAPVRVDRVRSAAVI